ncbi:AraC family transcriptional regulator [Aeromicrobium alkaliterrae]|uniref:AraC family transcriptional regulator n=1 Tax=Aeromicrobium alkaliterrae TaxID=302168 RepID=A0ABN2K4C9_9ACTN
MGGSLQAWDPGVPGLREVLYATATDHAYPRHTHDEWTVLVVDEGTVAYDLDRSSRHTTSTTLTVLPPGVPHDGQPADAGGTFSKRVLYLADEWLPDRAVGAAVDRSEVLDPAARAVLERLHEAARDHREVMAVEGELLGLRDRLLDHLGQTSGPVRDNPLARRLRTMLDDRLTEPFTVAAAAAELGVNASHLTRSFTLAYGIAPHQYVVGRRVQRARRLLLGGSSVAEAAVGAGFHDQSHLTRHFRRVLGTTPARLAA